MDLRLQDHIVKIENAYDSMNRQRCRILKRNEKQSHDIVKAIDNIRENDSSTTYNIFSAYQAAYEARFFLK